MDVRLPNGLIIKNVPDGTTKDQLMDKLKANGHDISLISNAGASEQSPVAEKEPTAAELKAYEEQHGEKPGLLESVANVVTGNDRKTAETEALPDWATMPEMNQASMASFRAGLGTLLSNPEETAKILQAQFPGEKKTVNGLIQEAADSTGVQVRQDEKGNYILKSPTDGKEYAIKPGFHVSDIPRALAGILAFTPTGKVPGVLELMGGSAATQAGIEATQAGTGGDFNTGDVVAAGAIPGVFHGLAKGAGALVDKAKNFLQGKPVITENPAAVAGAAEDIAAAQPKPVLPVGEAVVEAPEVVVTAKRPPQSEIDAARSANPFDESIPASPVLNAEQLAATAKSAGEGSKKATQTLASEVAPSPEVMESAKRLGIEDHLQPDHVSTNQVYRELAQAAKSIPGSEARAQELTGLSKVAERAEKVIADLGGTDDLSTLNESVKKQLQGIHEQTKSAAQAKYAQIAKEIPSSTGVSAENTINAIKQRADDLGGVEYLTAEEKDLLKKLQPANGKQPTYALLDSVRKDLNADFGKGAFAGTSDFVKSPLKQALFADQEAATKALGLADQFAEAQATAKLYKGMQDDLTSLFGKALDESFVGDISSATKALPTGDITKFTRLIDATKYLPAETRQQIVASGLNTAFGKSVRKGEINFGSYANWFEGLQKNKKAYTALMSNLPASARTQLKDLYNVSSGISKATGERITTGRIMAYKDAWKGADSMMGKLYEAAKQSSGRLAAGAAADVIGASGLGMAAALGSAFTKAKTPAIEAVDKLIASPAFAEVAKNPSKEAVRKLAHSAQFTNAMRKLGNPKEMSDRERWIIQTLQAGNEAE